MARMDAQRVAGLQVVHDHLAVQLDPGLALALQSLHAEPRAAENSGPQPLLKADRELHADGGAHESVAVDHVALAGSDLDRQDLAGKLGGNTAQARPGHTRRLAHKDAGARA